LRKREEREGEKGRTKDTSEVGKEMERMGEQKEGSKEN
jgi:hypothetical protein